MNTARYTGKDFKVQVMANVTGRKFETIVKTGAVVKWQAAGGMYKIVVQDSALI